MDESTAGALYGATYASNASTAPAWIPPDFDVSAQPRLSAEDTPCDAEDNFVRTIRWCPDGSVALAHCEDGSIAFLTSTSDSISVSHKLPQPAPVVDCLWYPTARSDEPALFCFFASVRECPVKLLDAQDGRLRASYRIVDHRERQIAPHSMAFNPYATKLYCGFEDAIEVFDINSPGEGVRLNTTPSKKSKDGLKGIVSSISFCTDYSGLFAASSLAGHVALFSEETGGHPQLYMEGAVSAITQLRFSPSNPNILFASERRTDRILFWDIRNSTGLLGTFHRPGKGTNQKMSFDVDPSGRWLMTGDEAGRMHVYDLQMMESEASPTLTFEGHTDTIGTVAIHPFKPLVMSASGSRHFSSFELSESDSSDTSDDDEDLTSNNGSKVVRVPRCPRPRPVDAKVKLWTFERGGSDGALSASAGS